MKLVYNFSFLFSKNNYFFINTSLEINNNFNIIIGRNGIGKSTLFKILQVNIKRSEILEGIMTFNGCSYNVSLKQDQMKIQKMVSLVCQNYNQMLALDFSVKENLEMASLKPYPSLKLLNQKIEYLDILKDLNINLDWIVKNLSGGQKQILAILMTLQKPISILLLDEPTSALDDENSLFVINFLKILAEKYNIIIIMIIHDKELISKVEHAAIFEIVKKDYNTRDIIKK